MNIINKTYKATIWRDIEKIYYWKTDGNYNFVYMRALFSLLEAKRLGDIL